MYKIFKVKKKNGKLRTISEPIPELKAMQWVILEKLSLLPLPNCVHGFVPGKDIVSNARPHRQKRYVLNVDIKDFFPSIKVKKYISQLTEEGWDLEFLSWIEAICFWNGSLPQGAPTSPVLANIYLSKFDKTMLLLAEKLGLDYTRYADDLTFSGPDTLKDELFSLLKCIDGCLIEYGLIRNKKKTKLMPYYQRQIVTGVVVNNERLTLSRKVKERLFQSLKGRSRSSLTEHELGYLEHVRHIDQKTYNKLCNIMI